MGFAKTGVAERGDDAVVGFFDGGVRQADEDDAWVATFARVHFHIDKLRLDPLQSRRKYRSQHEFYFWLLLAVAAAETRAMLRLTASR